MALILVQDVAVVFFCETAEELEGHDEEYYADAGPGEHGGRFDLP